MQPRVPVYRPAMISAAIVSPTVLRSDSPRLTGLDGLRGLAAFGVVVIHARLVVNGTVTPAAGAMQNLFSSFAVPFFLAAAFFFAAARKQPEPLGFWTRRRAWRLLMPYAFWTGVYAVAKTVKLLARHQADRSGEIWGDPAALLTTGGGALALYFLPLLFIGLLTARLLVGTLQSLPAAALWGFTALTLIGAEILKREGNGFDLGTGRAFGRALAGSAAADFWPARVALIAAAHAIRCLPYIMLAALCTRGLPRLATRWPGTRLRAVGAAAFFISALPALVPGCPALPESLPGFGALLVGWAFSQGRGWAAAGWWTARLGAFSFGVFLLHQLVLEAMQMALAGRVAAPAGAGFILGTSAAAFAACWAVLRAVEMAGSPALRRLCALPP